MKVVALVLLALGLPSAEPDGGAPVQRVLHLRLDLGAPGRPVHRAHAAVAVHAVAWLQPPGPRDQLVQQLVVHAAPWPGGLGVLPAGLRTIARRLPSSPH
jgi:hypothetical protein